jgi:hypothetical protein
MSEKPAVYFLVTVNDDLASRFVEIMAEVARTGKLDIRLDKLPPTITTGIPDLQKKLDEAQARKKE